jgi:hypothetical protein
MNMQSLTIRALSLGLVLALSGCEFTLTDLEDEIKDTVGEQAKKERNKAVFTTVMEKVTVRITETVADINQEHTMSLAPLAESDVIEIDDSTTLKPNGTMTLKGSTIFSSSASDSVNQLELEIEWTGLDIEFEEKDYEVSGSFDLEGEMTTAWAENFTSSTIDVSFTYVGSFTIDGETTEFDVEITMDNDGITVSGTLGGESFDEVISFEEDEQVDVAPEYVASCFNESTQVCTDYYGPMYTTTSVSESCSSVESPYFLTTPCIESQHVSHLVAKCDITSEGSRTVENFTSVDNGSQAACELEGGTYTAFTIAG